MLKKLSALILIALLVTACEKKQASEEVPQLTVAQIDADAAQYVGKKVSVTGTAVHVCKHGGKRLFVIGDTPEPRFKITAGEQVNSFDVALEGSDIVATGVVQEQKVDEAFLDNWENELSKSTKPEVGHEGTEHTTNEHGEAVEEHAEAAESLAQIKSMREELAETGKESLSFYSLECESFNEVTE